MNVIVSNVCRVKLSEEVLNLAVPGKVEIPAEMLQPRQLRVGEGCESLPAQLKWHRGSLITTVSPEVAAQVVEKGNGFYEPQYLLSYTREDYLADADVVANAEEFERISQSDATVVVVAVIGNSRSPLAVVRNIVSGCQKAERLEKDAKDALDASNVVLIEA